MRNANAPYEVGNRVRLQELYGWTYTGLQGKPGVDAHAVRRYVKGDWVLEIRAHEDQRRIASVVSIRTREQDAQWWAAKRSRGSGSERTVK
jgi:hypothetical protein